MSDDKNKRFKPSCSKNRISQGYKVQNVPAEGSTNVILDQILILPEIMYQILESLDLGHLKKVRLVCKSWLQEARAHMRREGIVVLDKCFIGSLTGRMLDFMKTRERQISALPQPFQAIDVGSNQRSFITENWLVNLGNLASPLVITRFTHGDIPWKRAIELVNQHCSTLEYLKLSFPYAKESSDIPPLNPEQTFPKLRHLSVDTWRSSSLKSQVTAFVSLIADIIKASPKLETFENVNASNNSREESELASMLMMAVNIRNVKTLKLSTDGLTSEAFQHLMAIPFWQLQNLKIIRPNYDASPLNDFALTATVGNSATTLKTLNLSRYSSPELVPGFPICPCVQELTLEAFPRSNNNFFAARFPSLQVLNVKTLILNVLEDSWTDFLPLSGLTTLRTKEYVVLEGGGDPDELVIRFLNKFPNLERVRFDDLFVQRCCKMVAAGDQRVSNLLGSVKHLEITGNIRSWRVERVDKDFYSSLSALPGIVTLTLVNFDRNLLRIPLEEMRSLKIIRLPWGRYFNHGRLRAISRGLEKLIITDCCSFSRTGDHPWVINDLHSFLDSAPNAECGCKSWKKTSPDWDWPEH